MFQLDARLKADCLEVGDLSLCKVLLMNNARFPWLILVPRREGITEVTELEHADQHCLMDEIAHVSDAMEAFHHPDKMNIAALGNIVSQLHVHVIARFDSDAAWPNPVWGQGGEPYALEEAKALVVALQEALADILQK